MITLKIDKTKNNKQEMLNYLDEVQEKIASGFWIGDDWDMTGQTEPSTE